MAKEEEEEHISEQRVLRKETGRLPRAEVQDERA